MIGYVTNMWRFIIIIVVVVPHDDHPQQRKLAWSTDNLMIALSDSKYQIYIVDTNGNLVRAYVNELSVSEYQVLYVHDND